MTVICLTNCPQKLRGDLTKWLIEINTGVYVGNINARVRDELWKRITDSIRSGQATMVFRAAGEQHMDFRVHNTTWQPVDFDGLRLMLRPGPEAGLESVDAPLRDGFSNAAQKRKARQMQQARGKTGFPQQYTVLDLETTGLDYGRDQIIEIGALRVRNGAVESTFCRLVRQERPLPAEVTALTGITDEMLTENGQALDAALSALAEFVGSDRLLCWNASFDQTFLQLGCSRCGIPIIRNKAEDVLTLARKTAKDLANYRLATVAQHFGIDCSGVHRALTDCYLTHAVFTKLNEN